MSCGCETRDANERSAGSSAARASGQWVLPRVMRAAVGDADGRHVPRTVKIRSKGKRSAMPSLASICPRTSRRALRWRLRNQTWQRCVSEHAPDRDQAVASWMQRAQRQLWLARCKAHRRCARVLLPGSGPMVGGAGAARGRALRSLAGRFPLMCTPKVSWLMYPHGSVCYVKSS